MDYFTHNERRNGAQAFGNLELLNMDEQQPERPVFAERVVMAGNLHHSSIARLTREQQEELRRLSQGN